MNSLSAGFKYKFDCFNHLNFKYCTFNVNGPELPRDGQKADDPNGICPRFFKPEIEREQTY